MNDGGKENPSPSAKAVFILWTPFHYFVLKNISKNLPNSEFVIVPMWCFSEEKNADNLQKTIGLLQNDGAHWRVFTKINDQSAVEKFFKQYDAIIATRLWSPLTKILYYGVFPEKKYVLVSYGAGKDLVTASPWSSFFDAVISEGEHTDNIYKTFVNSYAVGAPKFDDWFAGKLNEKNIADLDKKLDPNKTTILYLPTHGPFSSIRYYAKPLAAMADKYNCLVKFHYLNDTVDARHVGILKSHKDILFFSEDEDILPLFSAADIVMSDSSSAALEAILINKPLVILDTDFYSHRLKGNDETIWLSSLQYYQNSIEQRIKNKGDLQVGPIVRNHSLLREGIENAEKSHKEHEKNRTSLQKYLYFSADGKSGPRAAEVILAIMRSRKPSPPLAGLATRLYLRDRFIELRERKFNQQIFTRPDAN